MTMTLVSTVTVGAGGAASINFTSIPPTGTDLLIAFSARTTAVSTNGFIDLTINGSTLTGIRLRGTGSGASSATSLAVEVNGDSATASTFSNGSIYIPNYAGSTNKSLSIDTVTENNATAASQVIYAGLWSNTAAITSVTLTGQNTLMQYSTASLYTITKGSGGATVS